MHPVLTNDHKEESAWGGAPRKVFALLIKGRGIAGAAFLPQGKDPGKRTTLNYVLTTYPQPNQLWLGVMIML